MPDLPDAPAPLASWHVLEAEGLMLRYLAFEGAAGDAWLVFHGYGQKAADWIGKAEALARLGRVYLIELPGHGQSGVPAQGAAITARVWTHWLQALCRRERIHTCRILGYSLGGRLALASVCVLKERVEQLVFCAAEGASRSYWYELATGTSWGRRLLTGMVAQPGWVLGTLGWLRRLGLINKSLARFAGSQLATRAQRLLVARSWLALRALPGELEPVADILNRHAIPVQVYAGRHDRVVPLRRVLPLARAVPGAEVVVLEAGHNHLPDRVVEVLVGRAARN